MKRLYPHLFTRTLIALPIVLVIAIAAYGSTAQPVALAPAKTPTARPIITPSPLPTAIIVKAAPIAEPVKVAPKRTDNIDDDIPDAVADRWFQLATAYGDVGIRKIVAVRGKRWSVKGETTVVYVNVDAPNIVDEFTRHYARRAYFWLRTREPKRVAQFARGGWREFARLLVGTRWQ